MTRPTVTDYAVLRYMERVLGINVEEIRETIAAAVERGVDAKAPVIKAHGARFLNRQGKIVSTVNADQKLSWENYCSLLKDDSDG